MLIMMIRLLRVAISKAAVTASYFIFVSRNNPEFEDLYLEKYDSTKSHCSIKPLFFYINFKFHKMSSHNSLERTSFYLNSYTVKAIKKGCVRIKSEFSIYRLCNKLILNNLSNLKKGPQ